MNQGVRGDYSASGGGICVAQDCFEFGVEVQVPEHYCIVISTEPQWAERAVWNDASAKRWYTTNMDQRSVLKQHVDLVAVSAHWHCQGITIHYKTMQKWQHPSPLNEFCLASRLLATPVLRLIVMEHDCLCISRLLPAFFCYFYLGSSSCFRPFSQFHCWAFSHV